jgi:hypothetical protein
MIRALALALALSLAAPASPVFAAAAPKEEGADSSRAMDVLNLVVPVVREGRLVNYLFVNARIQLGNVDIFRTREQGHILRDALVKAVHRQSLAAADRDDQLNAAAAQALIGTVARQTLGANAVRSVEILGFSSLKQGRAPRS